MVVASVFIVLVMLVSCSRAQMIRQCFCNEVEPCTAEYLSYMVPCADQCQSRAAALGANYAVLRECIVATQSSVRGATDCVWQSVPDSCSNGPPRMIPKRYTQGLKIAIMAEMNSIAQRSGISTTEVGGLLSAGKKLIACMQNCMDKRSGGCMSSTSCQLQLPQDTAFVQLMKQCAIRNGFDTMSFRRLCQCIASSGVTKLMNICPRVQIS